MRLRGRRAVVTGAGSGIGQAIAEGLGREGAAVVAADRNRERACETAERLLEKGARATGMSVDTRSRAQVETLFTEAIGWLGGLEVLVCAAGISPLNPFLDIPEAEWEEVIDVNLKGLFLCGQAAARHMREHRGGSIINVTSQLSEVAQPHSAHYAASKGGGKMLTKAMALDLAPYGIRVNALAPGLTNTPMTRLDTPEGWAENERFIDHIPLGRAARPEEMVGAAIFLASDEASYVNGSTLLVDGGYLAV